MATVLASGLALGQGKGKGNPAQKGAGGGAAVSASVVFSASDRGLLLDYYNPGGRGLPPGLAKRTDLPPGLAKQLRKNGRLPPGLDKKIEAFPADIERRLPPLCAGCRRGVLGKTAVILSAAGAILDAIDLATR